ncbi:MAG: OmpA family protein [Candidatus Marinimicrobia bacterium]|jgi:chemotaxis protein MotB|nr:OmpA family protein [Candidatus Neomarinimicrobiota bacterium]MBT3629930.1 OmpA family protein [Candidatus Neomarinimicrobiota bacterium]MBT3825351.1 OmpA family protein [Candidatus Neomarinimicrobiota bacterium]MBT4132678.1 OmpA family protein [Candidatus Neomarinimicrobiota bacterium]MBT4296529.1 OmpA family protein [Candidatus Neomarinimicrobiota bacterium]
MPDISTIAERASNSWKVTYSDLLTGLLAFFLLLIIKAEQDANTTFKFADQMKDVIYAKVMKEKQVLRLDWLYVEHAGPKGIKLLIPSEIDDQTFFQSGEDQIVINFIFYLRTVAQVIGGLELEKIPIRNKDIFAKLEASGKTVKINVRIEGHSDSMPLGRSSRFRDNWDLSTARAHQVAQYLIRETTIPESYFSISGYGPFHPMVDERNYDENRRVEIYLDIQLIEIDNG